ncbi:MAG: SusC/RagA family TonB-linked outer membrane protein [bacterium]
MEALRVRYRVAMACAALFAAPMTLVAQATITGHVTTQGGTPLTGVTVSIAGIGVGSTTREDGGYSFTVPARNVTGQSVTLNARRVGYSPQNAPITLAAGNITHDFTMAATAQQLEQVVVTGAGTSQVRERVGSVINTVDSATITRATQPQNIISGLSGTTPNVRVNTQSGEPGGSAFVIIRGATSVTGTNQPLIVVDNQPIDNTTLSTNGGNASTVTQNRAADINPNDVESIQVLKGAAASAIYGARAANGVILITTKHGGNGPTRYAITSTQTFDNVIKTFPLQNKYGQGDEGAAGSCTDPDCNAPSNLSWGPLLPSGSSVFDHGKEIYDTGLTSDNAINLSGGNGRTNFFISGGITDQLGVMKGGNNRYDRSTVRLSASHQLMNTLTFGGNFSYFNAIGDYVQKGSNTSGLLLGALRTPPDFNNQPGVDPVSGLQRSYRFPHPTTASTTDSRGYDNPFFVLSNASNRSELGRFLGNMTANWVPTDWLSVNETFGADNYTDSRLEALPLTSSSDPVGNVTRFQITNLEVDHNLTATLSHQFNSNFDSRLVLGQNLNSRRNRQVYIFGDQLIAPAPLAIQNTVSYAPTETRSLRHIAAYFGQAEFDFYNQLHLTAGVRDDGFSTFGSSHRTALYPKVDAAWTFTNMFGDSKGTGVLSSGRLRAAYGETGREPPVYATITALSTVSLFGSGFADFIGSKQSGQGGVVTGPNLGSSDLRPERDREAEFGTDLGFFGQRSDLSFTYYNKRSTSVILPAPVNSASTGAISALVNGATISNKGAEVSLNVRPYTSKNVDVTLGANYARNIGRVESLIQGVQFIAYPTEGFTGSAGSSTVGYAPGVIRGQDFVRCGLGQKVTLPGVGTLANVDSACGTGAKKGALFIAGTNNRPVVNPDERVIADPNPRWTSGLTGQVRVGHLQFSTLFDIRHGGQVWDGTRAALDRFGTAEETNVRGDAAGIFGKNILGGQAVAGPGAGGVALKSIADWENWYTTDGGSASAAQAQFVEDGSFVKWREVSLFYTIDQSWLQSRFGLSSAIIRVAGRNLHTWTKYKGLDPETNLGGAEFLTQGLDFFQNPQTRSFVVAVTLNR